jgi:threonine dehydrogenase-like Zn-dependent dehydrogenase
MCRNGQFTEHGIKGLDGFAVERYRLQPRFAVKVDPSLGALGVLLEPASVVAKAWDHIEKIGRRASFEPKNVLVTGAGPIGLLAALLGVQRGLSVHVLDRATDGPKPKLVRDLGAVYHRGRVEDLCPEADIVVECTGDSALILGAIGTARPNGIICLTGVSRHGRHTPVDLGALNRELVLENNVVFGSVNANRAHYEQGGRALVQADRGWLERLVTRWTPLERWSEALEKDPAGVKTAIVFA